MKEVIFLTVVAILLSIIFYVVPNFFFSVSVGDSMYPTIKSGDIELVSKVLPIKENDLAIFYLVPTEGETKAILKRVIKIENNCYWVEGDNKQNSLDSREFGWLCSEDIESKMRVL